MELGSYSEDRLDQIIGGSELEIGRIRSVQMAAISEKRRRKSHLVDGYRSMVDWTAARADISHETARVDLLDGVAVGGCSGGGRSPGCR